jgi:TolA-binding protein
MDQGKLDEAVSRFDEFLQRYGDSALRPNALFGKSLCLAGLGKQAESLAIMQQFVDENPGHPLVDDARKVIDQLT